MESVSNLEQLYRYLKTEAENDPELHRRIDESSYRVVLSKLKNKISANDKPIQQALQVVGSTIHKDIENMVSESAITLIENKDILPFQLKDNNKIVVFSDQQSRNALIEKHLLDIAKELNIHIAIQGSVIKMMSNDQSEDALTEKIKGQDLVILATYNLMKDPINAQRILNVANRNAIPAVVIATCKPYDIAYLNSVKANIAIYGITGFDITNKNINSLQTNIRSGLRTLFLTPDKRLMNTPIGKLPIDIKTPDLNRVLYPYGHGLTY